MQQERLILGQLRTHPTRLPAPPVLKREQHATMATNAQSMTNAYQGRARVLPSTVMTWCHARTINVFRASATIALWLASASSMASATPKGRQIHRMPVRPANPKRTQQVGQPQLPVMMETHVRQMIVALRTGVVLAPRLCALMMGTHALLKRVLMAAAQAHKAPDPARTAIRAPSVTRASTKSVNRAQAPRIPTMMAQLTRHAAERIATMVRMPLPPESRNCALMDWITTAMEPLTKPTKPVISRLNVLTRQHATQLARFVDTGLHKTKTYARLPAPESPTVKQGKPAPRCQGRLPSDTAKTSWVHYPSERRVHRTNNARPTYANLGFASNHVWTKVLAHLPAIAAPRLVI